MRRNMFEKILQFPYAADSNNLPKAKDTKVGKVAHYIWDIEFDIDECMVEYFGQYRTFLKQ